MKRLDLKQRKTMPRLSFGAKGPMEKLPKARITEGLPLGNLGDLAIVYKAEMEDMERPVAVKMSRIMGMERKAMWKEELEKSRALSALLPNVASYHHMVDVEGLAGCAAFAMEIVVGFPILDRNICCFDPQRFSELLGIGAVGQLAESLGIASSNGWRTGDLQYFVLLRDQRLNGRDFRRGDLVLFDFCDWCQGAGKWDFANEIRNLEGLIRGD